MNFRAASGQRVDWIDTSIASGFSNFLFVDQHYDSHSVLRRILSLARKHGYQSLLVEEILEKDCPLLAEENAALALRSADFQSSITHRLTFWRCRPDQAKSAHDFIGYAIFKSDRFKGQALAEGHVYEAVLPPIRQTEQNNFIHCRKDYTVETLSGPQNVSGVLYAQQNGLTFVCAHVALRSALACLLPDKDISYSRMNRLAGIDHQLRQIGEGKDGLSPEDMEKILSGLGIAYEKIVHEPRQALNLPTEFQRDLYGFIESGDPALLGFELDDQNPGPEGSRRHIVPVIGHTFNDDAWVPEAQRSYFGSRLSYFPSESWLSSYVLHDDNFGPYYCLPRHFLKKENFRIILGMRRHALSVNAVEAEAVGFDFLVAVANKYPQIGQDWFDRFSVYTRTGLLVLRSLLVEKRNYLGHLRRLRDGKGVALEAAWVAELEANLPERFWMIEASAQELFTVSRRKFGEVLLDCSQPLPRPLNAQPLLALRLPGKLWSRVEGQVRESITDLQSHTEIFSAFEQGGTVPP